MVEVAGEPFNWSVFTRAPHNTLEPLPPEHSDGTTTCGEYQMEADAEEAFDQAVKASGAFKTFKRPRGTHISPRPGQKPQGVEIDRILWPLPELRSQGWPTGPIGVELKKSGVKVGPPISQLIDYSRSSFQVTNGLWITTEWNFLFPMAPIHGNLESIVAQQRLGGAFISHRGRLTFHSGAARTLARFGPAPDWDIRPKNFNHGRKTGSR